MTRIHLHPWLFAAAGLWLLGSPYALAVMPGGVPVGDLPGLTAFLSAGMAALGVAMFGAFGMHDWEAVSGLVLGATLIAAPWGLDLGGAPLAFWNALLSGAFLCVVAIWDVLAPRRREHA